MHRFLAMKTSIEYLHIHLKSRLAITQNEMKTGPALVTAQIPISASILVSVEPHFGFQREQVLELQRLECQFGGSVVVLT